MGIQFAHKSLVWIVNNHWHVIAAEESFGRALSRINGTMVSVLGDTQMCGLYTTVCISAEWQRVGDCTSFSSGLRCTNHNLINATHSLVVDISGVLISVNDNGCGNKRHAISSITPSAFFYFQNDVPLHSPCHLVGCNQLVEIVVEGTKSGSPPCPGSDA